MNRWLLIGLLSFFVAESSQAGLGETLEQAKGRYGSIVKQEQSEHLPQNEAGMMYEFNKDGFRIQIRLVGGKVAWILYIKDDGPIFESEIRTLLENNAEGSTWDNGAEVTDHRIYKKHIKFGRTDGLADAEYHEIGTYHGLGIITKAWRHATSAASGL